MLGVSSNSDSPPVDSAYDFVKSFAHYGGAMLAVDVESWDRDQDVSLQLGTLRATLMNLMVSNKLQYIIELGLAYVTWQKGNLAPPRVRAEHISKLRKAHDCFHACLVTKMTCLVIEEHKDKRNGLYSPDAKDVGSTRLCQETCSDPNALFCLFLDLLRHLLFPFTLLSYTYSDSHMEKVAH